MADIAIKQAAVQTTPGGYTIPGAQEIVLKSVRASFDGTGAAGNFVPVMQIIEPAGGTMVECPASVTVVAGGSADVSWFPGLGGPPGGPSGTTAQIRAPVLDTPDASTNTFPSLTTSNSFTNVRRLLPYYAHGGSGSWVGSVRVPADYFSNPQVIVTAVTASTTGAVRWIVGSAVVNAGVSEDTAFTNESAQNITVPGTALQRFDTTFNLSTTPIAGADLNLVCTRDGGNAGDTCTGLVAVWAVTFIYKT